MYKKITELNSILEGKLTKTKIKFENLSRKFSKEEILYCREATDMVSELQ